MEIIAYAAVAYMAVQFIIALVNLFTRQYLKKSVPESHAMVSILIPARNEEENIGRLLDDLLALEYKNFEILVYDDESTDKTGSIIMGKSMGDSRIRYFQGNGPLPGWLGKNNACHQLARQSRGEYLLFLDADVRVKSGLMADAMAEMERRDLDLLSLFPVQQMRSPGEWLTVPSMNRILLGNLPLMLIRRCSWPAFAAANGQFMMFKSETYKNNWYHKQVSDEKVEDILIITRMKKMRLKVQTLLSGGQVSCRMYFGFTDSIAGFSKNILAFFGNNWLILFAYLILTTLGPFAVWMSISFSALVVYLSVIILSRVIISYLSRQPVLLNLMFMPFQQLSLILISILALFRQMTRTHKWKGRRIGR